MKQAILLLCILMTIVSCGKVEKPKKPENLIPKDKMVDILFDVFVFNAAKGTDKRILEENNVTPAVYIYDKYQIDSLQFVKSNEYYAYDIKTYDEIIGKVQAKLKAKKAKFQKQIDAEEERRKKRLDSIKKIGDTIKVKEKSKIFTQV